MRLQKENLPSTQKAVWCGKAQILAATSLIRQAVLRALALFQSLRVVVAIYKFVMSGSAGIWTIVSLVGLLGFGTVDPRTANLILKGPTVTCTARCWLQS